MIVILAYGTKKVGNVLAREDTNLTRKTVSYGMRDEELLLRDARLTILFTIYKTDETGASVYYDNDWFDRLFKVKITSLDVSIEETETAFDVTINE